MVEVRDDRDIPKDLILEEAAGYAESVSETIDDVNTFIDNASDIQYLIENPTAMSDIASKVGGLLVSGNTEFDTTDIVTMLNEMTQLINSSVQSTASILQEIEP